jgi:hypothetical protein
LITPPLELEQTYKGVLLKATVLKNGTVSYGEKTYTSPSAAAGMARKIVVGAPAGRAYPKTNGWIFWKYRDRETGDMRKLDYLRCVHQICKTVFRAHLVTAEGDGEAAKVAEEVRSSEPARVAASTNGNEQQDLQRQPVNGASQSFETVNMGREELKQAALKLTEELTNFGERWDRATKEMESLPFPETGDDEQQYMRELEVLEHFQAEFQTKYRPAAVAIKDSILKQVPARKRKALRAMDFEGVDGSDPVDNAVNNLSKLAEML